MKLGLFIIVISIPFLNLHAQDYSRNNYAFFFPINKYDKNKGYRPLVNQHKNAKSISKYLESEYHYKTDIFPDLTFDSIFSTLKLISDRFNDRTYDPEGSLILFFSGHGDTLNNNGYFIPSDGDADRLWGDGGINYNELRPIINNIPSKHIIVVVDACYSGAFDPDWQNRLMSGNGFNRPGELSSTDLLIEKYKKYKTRKFFTSATINRTSDQSDFAKYFIRAFETNGGKDNILTYNEIFAKLSEANITPYSGDFGDNHPSSNFLLFHERYFQNKNNSKYQLIPIDWKEDRYLGGNQEVKLQVRLKDSTGNFVPNILINFDVLPEGGTIANVVTDDNGIATTNWHLSNHAGQREIIIRIDESEDISSQQLILKANVFKTVKLGHQLWMAENLNVDIKGESWCNFDNPEKCKEYGRFYTYEAAVEGCLSLGDGWHLPNLNEFKQMMNLYGGCCDPPDPYHGSPEAYKALQRGGSSGFDIVPSGRRNTRSGNYDPLPLKIFWLASFSDNEESTYYFTSSQNDKIPSGGVTYANKISKTGMAVPVRCVRD